MKSINLFIFKCAWWKDDQGKGCWFKLFGKGLYFTNGRYMFSERYGYTKFMKLPFGYRVRLITK